MSAWGYAQNERGQDGDRFDWSESGWDFDALDDDNEWRGNDPFDDLHFQHLIESETSHRAHSSLANTNSRAPPAHRTHGASSSRSADTSFLDELLHATAPERRRPQTVTNAPVTHRHAVDPPRPHATNSSAGTRQNHTFGYITNNFFGSSENEDSTPGSPPTRTSTGLSRQESQEFATLEDTTESEGDLSDMPATCSRRSNRGTGVVDLTSGSSTSASMARARKRSADDSSTAQGPARKRGRASYGDIEQIDLSEEAPSAEAELLQKQQEETIRLQQEAEKSSGPQKIGRRSCIICMENFTNCTIAPCGHFYCHECLYQALLAGERNSDRGTGTCPQCRKPLSRNNRRRRDMIPLSFMKKATFASNQRKRQQAQ